MKKKISERSTLYFRISFSTLPKYSQLVQVGFFFKIHPLIYPSRLIFIRKNFSRIKKSFTSTIHFYIYNISRSKRIIYILYIYLFILYYLYLIRYTHSFVTTENNRNCIQTRFSIHTSRTPCIHASRSIG